MVISGPQKLIERMLPFIVGMQNNKNKNMSVKVMRIVVA
jgi:hypothetical protein